MLLLRDGMDCLVSGVDQSCQFHLLFIHPEFQSFSPSSGVVSRIHLSS